ncbi:MAG: SDR family oxidoreductase [Dehalococcoidales bacterium]|nr:SDR family oxidoreductase [Dehalococcoidales bacterium]
MKVLLLGATGMLGHKLYQVLTKTFEVTGTIRGPYSDIAKYNFFEPIRIIPHVDMREISRVERVIKEVIPEVVINCVGIVKSLEKEKGVLLSIWLNSLFPHQLYQICKSKGTRLIHVSTDCVFSGERGHYREEDLSDAKDIYGKTKYLGEVNEPEALTIRTSFIGRELSSGNGLLEWFLANEGGNIRGYTNAIFSGFTSLHLAMIISDIITKHQNLSGVYHISSEPISKFELLSLIKKSMGINISIKPYPDFYCNRSLDSTKYRHTTGFTPPPWNEMVNELVQDARQYLKWREDDFSR